MSDMDKIKDAMNMVDIDSIIDEFEDGDGDTSDNRLIRKHQEKMDCIVEAKQNLKDARMLGNKQWAEALLKKSAENIMISQEIFTKEIEDDPASKNLTALGEVSNSLVATVKAVQDLENDEIKLKQSQEKIDLRRKEVENSMGIVLDAEGNSKNIIGIGTGQDILNLIHNGIDPAKEE
jgi:hypothetical protein